MTQCTFIASYKLSRLLDDTASSVDKQTERKGTHLLSETIQKNVSVNDCVKSRHSHRSQMNHALVELVP